MYTKGFKKGTRYKTLTQPVGKNSKPHEYRIPCAPRSRKRARGGKEGHSDIRREGSFQKRKVVSQVIMALASSLEITPNEVLRAYIDYKKDAKGDASAKVKKDD